MKRYRIPTNDQILNFSGVEDGQEFFAFEEHLVTVPSCAKRRESSRQQRADVRARARCATRAIPRTSSRRGWGRLRCFCSLTRLYTENGDLQPASEKADPSPATAGS